LKKNNGTDDYVSPYLTLNSDIKVKTSVPKASTLNEKKNDDLDESENVAIVDNKTTSDKSITTGQTITPNGRVAVSYKVKKKDNLLAIADLFDVRVSDIRNWNNIPYTKTIGVGENLTVFVPADKKEFYASLDNQTSIEKTTSKNTVAKNSVSWVFHKVRRGENLRTIALRYGIKVNELRDWNNIHGNKIAAGKKIRILAAKNTSYFASNEKNSNKTSVYKYRVKRGDSISEIAHKFGVSVASIKNWNG